MYFEVFSERDGCGPGEVSMGNRKVLMFGSNDYLDLITHPKVMEAAAQAVRRYGSGCSGSRLLNGTLDLHVKLEAELAASGATATDAAKALLKFLQSSEAAKVFKAVGFDPD